MPTDLELQVATVANTLGSLLTQCAGLQQQIATASADWTNIGAAALLNAFPTYTPDSTGGIGTPDGSSNTAHPINTSVAPGNEITLALSANQYASILTLLQGISSAIGGAAVSANGAASQLLALVSAPG